MKLLYLSCHASLEYDELSIFSDLGFEVFSVGFYLNPTTPTRKARPPLSIQVNAELKSLFEELHPDYTPVSPIKLHPDFLNKFDIVVNAHYLENLELNWGHLKDKLVIRRTITQGNDGYEARFKPFRDWGLKVVRFSPKEVSLKSFNGADAVIRVGIDPELFKGWKGISPEVLTIQTSMRRNSLNTQFDLYNFVTQPFNRTLIGFGNEDVPWALRDVDDRLIQQKRQECRVYYSSCTKPGAYAYTFAEALMTGCPVVTLGPKLGNFDDDFHGRFFEQHEILDTLPGSGLWSDNPAELKDFIQQFMDNEALAAKTSKLARELALKVYSKDVAKEAWRRFFESEGVSCKP